MGGAATAPARRLRRMALTAVPQPVASRQMEFRILGPLEARDERGRRALGGTKPRAVLAMLLLHANEPVSPERLAAGLWGEDVPAGAIKKVHVHVSRLRKALGNGATLETTPAGYRLAIGPDQLDAARFERRVVSARQALLSGQFDHAAAILRDALDLWHGPPLA